MAFAKTPAVDRVPRRPGSARLVVAMGGASVAAALVLLAATAIAMQAPWLPAALLAGGLLVAWCSLRPSRWVYLLIATIFLETPVLSLHVAGARVRLVQILLVPAASATVLLGAGGLVRLRRVPLLPLLLVYLACNFVSALFGVSLQQGLKIFLLLASLVLLYAVVYTLLRDDRAAWPRVLRFFLIIGLLQVAFGLYQVAAGLANARLGLALPIPPEGIRHTEYLGTAFGRPYGTLPEPDTYGAVCLFYALLLGLVWLTAAESRTRARTHDAVAGAGSGLIVATGAAALVGLLVGFVRASWFGFMVGLAWAFWMRLRGRLRPVRVLRLAAACALVVLMCVGALATSPQLRQVLARRFSTGGPHADETALTGENVRFRQMAVSLRLFQRRPLLGNGPGSFSILGVTGAHETYYLASGADLTRIYDPSIVTTVLNDTGLLGAGAFVLLAAGYFRHVRRQRRMMTDPRQRNWALAANCAVVGLFASFLFTHYFWLPLTWLFLAMTMLLFENGKAETPSRENDSRICVC